MLWILSLTMMGVRLAGNMVRYYGDQVPGALPVTTLTQTLAQLAVVVLGIVLLLSALDFRITPILTALGVGGLAVALALQDTLSNLFSGFYVAVARQVRLGDYIKLNTGEEGYVTDIGWRSTTMRALANNLIMVPNAKLAQAIVTNFHLPEKRMGSSVQVSVSYESDIDRVEAMLLEVVQRGVNEIPGMVAEPAPNVQFDPGFGDSGLGFTVNYQIAEFARQFGVRNELRRRILRRFGRRGSRCRSRRGRCTCGAGRGPTERETRRNRTRLRIFRIRRISWLESEAETRAVGASLRMKDLVVTRFPSRYFQAALAKRSGAFVTLNEVSRQLTAVLVEIKTKSSGSLHRVVRSARERKRRAQVSRPAGASGIYGYRGRFAQIFDNLVGCSKKNFVRTLSITGAIDTTHNDSNESLIPAQNQRWRRA